MSTASTYTFSYTHEEADSVDLDTILKLRLNTHRSEVIEFLKQNDVKESFEGGVDSWWGLGSVFLFELNFTAVMTVTRYGVTVTIH